MRGARTLTTGALVLAAALSLGACGGGGRGTTSTATTPGADDRAQILATAKRYQSAFLDGDYTSACALLTPAARATMTEAARSTNLGGGTCAGIMEAAAGTVSPDQRGALDGLQVRIVSVNGDHAVVSTTAAGSTDTTPLLRVDGVWRVDTAL